MRRSRVQGLSTTSKLHAETQGFTKEDVDDGTEAKAKTKQHLPLKRLKART